MQKPTPEAKSEPAAASNPVDARPHLPVPLLAILLVLVTLAVFWPATRCDFVNFDDDLYVTANPHVQNGLGWHGIKWAFLNPVASNWHPLTLLSHMLDCQLFGLNPWGHHLTSVLLHALNALLVFILLRQMTGATWRSLFVAAMFALHPLHVESVAWVSERKDVLSCFFGLLSLIFYARYARDQAPHAGAENKTAGPATLDYMAAVLFLAFGLMSKAMLVTWPFVMLLLDYWPLRRLQPGRAWRLVAEKIPFFTLAAMGSYVTLLVQRHAGAMAPVTGLPPGARVSNALISYCRYLGKWFDPVNLAVFYPHPGYWPLAQVLLAGAALVAISALVWVMRQGRPFLLAGWLWFLVTLLPVIGLVQVGDQSMADRYTYIPSLGLLVLVVWGVRDLAQKWRYSAGVLPVAGAAALILCFWFTQSQIGYWRNSETLFRHALAVTENNHIAHNNYGVVLKEQGQLDEAIGHFREAVRLRADDAPAWINLGDALFKKGQFDEAISQYQEAIRLDPDNAGCHKNLGNTFFKKGQYAEAISQYREAVRLSPNDATARYDLGKALDKNGQTNEAISQLQGAIRLKPDYAEAYNNLGYFLQSKGWIDEAIQQYQMALRLKPDYALARNNLAAALKKRDAPADH